MKSIVLLVLVTIFANAEFINLSPKELQNNIDQNIVVIDIRTPPEWKEVGLVPTSKTIMFFDEKGKYDISSWLGELSKYIKSKDQEFVLVCRSGNRTAMVGNFLSKQVGYKKVYHLKNGIKSWIKEKRKISKYP